MGDSAPLDRGVASHLAETFAILKRHGFTGCGKIRGLEGTALQLAENFKGHDDRGNVTARAEKPQPQNSTAKFAPGQVHPTARSKHSRRPILNMI
jgi:hypothetical protein